MATPPESSAREGAGALSEHVAQHVERIVAAGEAHAQAVRDAAEAEAEGIRRRAEAEAAELVRQRREAVESAQRYLSDTMARADALAAEQLAALQEVVGDLGARTARVRDELFGLVGALDQAARALAERRTGAPVPPPAPPTTAPPAGEETPAARSAHAARLAAMEMALDGRSRSEVAEHLRESLGLGDATDVLDEVFGPGVESLGMTAEG